MSLRPDGLIAYTYTNPDNEFWQQTWDVIPVQPNDPSMARLPIDFLKVKRDALTKQYEGRFDAAYVNSLVNPDDPDMVAAEAELLRESALNDDGYGPRFIYASMSSIAPDRLPVIGISKAVIEVRRRSPLALWPEECGRIAAGLVKWNSQNLGVNASHIMSEADSYDPDMPAFAKANADYGVMSKIVEEKLGLKRRFLREWDPVFGRVIRRAIYDGPKMSEVVERLVDWQPFLADRQPVVPAEIS